MNSQPLISVLMPMYNASAYLRESLESVLNQTFTMFELLVIDDGSTDDSAAIVRSYLDERIRLISNMHDFISSLNKGIDASIGKYIARMDADDVMLPHRLETQFNFMESNSDVDICGSWAACFGESQMILKYDTEHIKIITNMLFANPLAHPTVMMRRSIFEKNAELRYSVDYPYAEDYKLWTELAGKGFRFSNIPNVLLRYRRSNAQVTEQHSDVMLTSSIKIRIEYAEFLMDQIAIKEERYFNPTCRMECYKYHLYSRLHFIRFIYGGLRFFFSFSDLSA